VTDLTSRGRKPWPLIGKQWTDAGMESLGKVAIGLGKVLRERVVYATNAARSLVATHIQEVEPRTAAEFNEHFKENSHDNSVVTGLRECLRFIFELSGLEKTTGIAKRGIPIAKIEPSASDRTLWVSEAGVVYGYMHEWLHDEDLAAWWCHPGQLVKLRGKSVILTHARWQGDSFLEC
jgi:hypothetical protein